MSDPVIDLDLEGGKYLTRRDDEPIFMNADEPELRDTVGDELAEFLDACEESNDTWRMTMGDQA